MASRYFQQFQGTLERGVVFLYGRATTNGSSAPTFTVTNSQGISNVTRTATGRYKIALQDTYYELLGFTVTYASVAATDITGISALTPFMLSPDSVNSSTDPFVELRVKDNANTLTDLPTGTIVYFTLILKNSRI